MDSDERAQTFLAPVILGEIYLVASGRCTIAAPHARVDFSATW